jgi:hypothetical protein
LVIENSYAIIAEEGVIIGEKIGEFQGKVTGRRVLPNDGSSPRVETSFEIRGVMLGVES